VPTMSRVSIRQVPAPPPLNGDADDPVWATATTAHIENFRPESTPHRPVTAVRLCWSRDSIHLWFDVQDRYVRSVETEFNGPVCRDSCVEFFVRPRDDGGYMNFEINAGGTAHISAIRDWTRKPGGFADFTPVTAGDGKAVGIRHSLPSVVSPEIETPTNWTIQLSIPFALICSYLGGDAPSAGDTWRGNFYKCGDATSHPHWASWAPVPRLDFHDPLSFGELNFE